MMTTPGPSDACSSYSSPINLRDHPIEDMSERCELTQKHQIRSNSAKQMEVKFSMKRLTTSDLELSSSSSAAAAADVPLIP